jgi:hypothetical protein
VHQFVDQELFLLPIGKFDHSFAPYQCFSDPDGSELAILYPKDARVFHPPHLYLRLRFEIVGAASLYQLELEMEDQTETSGGFFPSLSQGTRFDHDRFVWVTLDLVGGAEDWPNLQLLACECQYHHCHEHQWEKDPRMLHRYPSGCLGLVLLKRLPFMTIYVNIEKSHFAC